MTGHRKKHKIEKRDFRYSQARYLECSDAWRGRKGEDSCGFAECGEKSIFSRMIKNA